MKRMSRQPLRSNPTADDEVDIKTFTCESVLRDGHLPVEQP